MDTKDIVIAGLGWVLPRGVGSGTALLAEEDLLDWTPADNAALDGFSAKPYLNSVKGYLDPASAYLLAACSLALQDWEPAEESGINEEFGISSLTQFGAPQTGSRFYSQLLEKGPRFASPLLFPHSYSNTAGNLAAIEFGFGGPHMVLYGTVDVRDALDFAATRLKDGTATDMLVGVYEAVSDAAVSADTRVLNGAVALWLTCRSAGVEGVPLPVDAAMAGPGTESWLTGGSVNAMLAVLSAIL